MPAPEDRPSPPRRTGVLVAVLVAAALIAFVVLHVTGVIGPGSH